MLGAVISQVVIVRHIQFPWVDVTAKHQSCLHGTGRPLIAFLSLKLDNILGSITPSSSFSFISYTHAHVYSHSHSNRSGGKSDVGRLVEWVTYCSPSRGSKNKVPMVLPTNLWKALSGGLEINLII